MEEISEIMEDKPKTRTTKISLELKMDQMMQYMDKTMNTWMMIINEIREENSKMNLRITNIEKDIRYLKNRNTESGNIIQTIPMRRVATEANKIVSQVESKASSSLCEQDEYLIGSAHNETTIGFDLDKHVNDIRRPSVVSSMKMASQRRMVESTTIQMPRNQFEKIVQMSSSSEAAIQQMLSQQNGSVFTSLQQQHFQQHQQQIISKSQSTPTLPMHPQLAIEYPIMIRQYRDMKVEKFDFEEEFVRKCLEMNSIVGDIRMFKKMYLENVSKEFYPIRYFKKTYQYWLNGKMHDDIGGSYVKNTITRNIETLYMKLNTFEYYGEKVDKFMNNQEHICKLSDEKYKDKILQQIGQIIL